MLGIRCGTPALKVAGICYGADSRWVNGYSRNCSTLVHMLGACTVHGGLGC